MSPALVGQGFECRSGGWSLASLEASLDPSFGLNPGYPPPSCVTLSGSLVGSVFCVQGPSEYEGPQAVLNAQCPLRGPGPGSGCSGGGRGSVTPEPATPRPISRAPGTPSPSLSSPPKMLTCFLTKTCVTPRPICTHTRMHTGSRGHAGTRAHILCEAMPPTLPGSTASEAVLSTTQHQCSPVVFGFGGRRLRAERWEGPGPAWTTSIRVSVTPTTHR